MCRLAIFNRQGAKEIEKIVGLERFFSYLEQCNGGHGNGYAIIDDCNIKIRKGITLSCKQIAKDLFEKDFDWAIFHTRIASVGSTTYKNCHPFKYGESVLAMNGTERSVKFLANRLKMTDTETIALLSYKLKISLSEFVQDFDSVFVGFEEGTPFISAGGLYGKNLKYYEDNGAIIFASEFPNGYLNANSIYPKRPFFWVEGMDVKEEKYPSYPYYHPTSYYSGGHSASAKASKKKATKKSSKNDWYTNYKMSLIEQEELEKEQQLSDEDVLGGYSYGWDL